MLYNEEPFRVPAVDLVLYAREDSDATWYLSEEELRLNQGTFTLQCGLNYLQITPEVTANKEEYLHGKNEQDPKFKWEEPDNGKMYLAPGDYTIAIGDHKVGFSVKK